MENIGNQELFILLIGAIGGWFFLIRETLKFLDFIAEKVVAYIKKLLNK